MGQCVESGYGLVGERNKLMMLDPKATSWVVALLKRTGTEIRARLRVEREENNKEMETINVSIA